MSHQQLFEPVLADEPPARDTLDGLVRRSRRRIRRRRLTATGVGLVAATVVAVLTLPGTAPPMVTGAPPTTSASSPSRPPDVLLGEDLTEPVDAATSRLTDALTVAVKRVAPSGWHDAVIIRRDVRPPSSSADVDVDAPQSTVSYEFKTEVHVDGVVGKLVVTIKRRSVELGCAAAFPADVAPSVLRSQCAPNADVGQPSTAQTVRDERPGMIRHVASQNRQDATTVEVSVSNEPALTGAPPLTGEQVVQLAGDPGLTLYP
ncbi:hypothetical protein AB0K00_48245 [Dactylosporangium sp. NPDC049525]|uniref:hypothetical protein n=1 Tax=Dactylosporangium sp. NPDC049525 TaxID=3154730 RepID=UPI0034220410